MSAPLDPFEIDDEWFVLDLVGYQVLPGETTQGGLRETILATIAALHLNDADYRLARSEYAEEYLKENGIPLDYLERRAPFVARELRRQNRLRPTDQVPPA